MQHRLMCLGGPQDGLRVCGTASFFSSPDGSTYMLCNLRLIGRNGLSFNRQFWKWTELSLQHALELASQRDQPH